MVATSSSESTKHAGAQDTSRTRILAAAASSEQRIIAGLCLIAVEILADEAEAALPGLVGPPRFSEVPVEDHVYPLSPSAPSTLQPHRLPVNLNARECVRVHAGYYELPLRILAACLRAPAYSANSPRPTQHSARASKAHVRTQPRMDPEDLRQGAWKTRGRGSGPGRRTCAGTP
jgi:hypothetical protein